MLQNTPLAAKVKKSSLTIDCESPRQLRYETRRFIVEIIKMCSSRIISDQFVIISPIWSTCCFFFTFQTISFNDRLQFDSPTNQRSPCDVYKHGRVYKRATKATSRTDRQHKVNPSIAKSIVPPQVFCPTFPMWRAGAC